VTRGLHRKTLTMVYLDHLRSGNFLGGQSAGQQKAKK